MPPEQAEIRSWLVKALHDWNAARKLLAPDAVELDVAAFHCQQAVEKTLKAYLLAQGAEFEKIHDLRRLVLQCARIDAQFESLRERVQPLTVYAVAFRYPGPSEPSRQEVEEALVVVEDVWAFVTGRLPGEVVPT